uniref:Ribosomal RNA processing 1 n=1 Tax=Neogobius melanostomus TaxID=47308 RepID=A0A8C6TSQ7_9GOBI
MMMASVEEPEVQFAQRLASNEKPLRRKALKKLRSYIGARSRSQTGFSEEELLKLWKGLFYCLWMQDKPLLQEELSTQISGLVHHFHSFSAQLLYLQTFLTTVKREWTGIDRLRMDKYFQLVRFMFRQMFEVLQRSEWEPSCVRLFLELLASALLQTGAPPVGLQLHVLDLYLRELAVVGAQELSAAQNLVFIEPFCKAAAKTKDRSLFRAICSGIFSTIIDQAPFAIQELMDELQQDTDSGQASDDSGAEEPERQSKGTRDAKKKASKRVNGLKAHSEEEDEGDEDNEEDEEDDCLSDSDKPLDEDVGPVLQFDYGAVADKLLELSSRHNTPSRNRQRLYKIIKVLRDLSQGSFPQDEYPEEVSTDEDDDDFGSRKRMKRRHTEEEEQAGARREESQREEDKKGGAFITKFKTKQ